jgi:hypothetical protein
VRDSKIQVGPMFALRVHTKNGSLSCDYAMALGADARGLSKNGLQSDSRRGGAASCALISGGSRTALTRPR